MATVTLQIPDDVLSKLQAGGFEPDNALRLAGMSYADFLVAAAKAKVVLFPVDLGKLKEEATRGFTLGRQRFADHPPGQGGPE